MKYQLNIARNPQFFRGKEQTVFGTLNPIMWNRHGQAIKFAIYSEDEEDIIIEDFKHKRKLEKLVNKTVQASGVIRVNDDGEKYIKLKRIRELSGPTSPTTPSPWTKKSFWTDEFAIRIPQETLVQLEAC